MSAGRQQPLGKRLETWLWTGPVGHLLGGGADLAAALWRHGPGRKGRARLRARRRGRTRSVRGSSGLRR